MHQKASLVQDCVHIQREGGCSFTSSVHGCTKKTDDPPSRGLTSKPVGICWAYSKGTCRYGENCKFAHTKGGEGLPKQAKRERGRQPQTKGGQPHPGKRGPPIPAEKGGIRRKKRSRQMRQSPSNEPRSESSGGEEEEDKAKGKGRKTGKKKAKDDQEMFAAFLEFQKQKNKEKDPRSSDLKVENIVVVGNRAHSPRREGKGTQWSNANLIDDPLVGPNGRAKGGQQEEKNMIYHIKVTVDPERNLRSIEREARILSTRVKFAHSNGSEAEAVLLNDTCSSLNIVGMNLLRKDPDLNERSEDSEGL